MGRTDPDPDCLMTSEKHMELTTDAQWQISKRPTGNRQQGDKKGNEMKGAL